ncbi:hypothetical protein C8Q72DRAFT_177358 [Fomitopsis betulina]|nr:hypothetical protein C8Q72DRAFT_193511 [Fomitopsis betulina]KAI0716073.1 hypothetical protein C8Q72DRAFT_177358 [Fomitopsis betulina]
MDEFPRYMLQRKTNVPGGNGKCACAPWATKPAVCDDAPCLLRNIIRVRPLLARNRRARPGSRRFVPRRRRSTAGFGAGFYTSATSFIYAADPASRRCSSRRRPRPRNQDKHGNQNLAKPPAGWPNLGGLEIRRGHCSVHGVCPARPVRCLMCSTE